MKRNNLKHSSTASPAKLSPTLLRPYQQDAITFLYEHDRAILPLPMGAGKSIITLSALADLLDQAEIGKVLLFAPKRVCDLVWEQEVHKWSHTSDIRTSLVTGSIPQRERAMSADADLYICNYENLVWLFDNYDVEQLGFDTLVLDELIRLQNTGGVRYRKLRKYVKHFKHRYGLNGTLTGKGMEQLFGQQFIIDDGRALGRSKQSFLDNYFDFDKYTYTLEPKPAALETVLDRIAPYMYSIDEADYTAQLPKLIENVIYVDLPPGARKRYDNLEEELADTELGVSAANAGVLTNMLQQMANGFIYDGAGGFTLLHEEKMKAFEEVCLESVGNSVLGVYNFKADVKRLLMSYPGTPYLGGGVTAAAAESACKAWNEGALAKMFGHPASFGHGLNLQHGGHIMAWFGLNWSLDLMQQTIARLLRADQKHPVTCHFIVARGTVDEDILRAWQHKLTVQQAVDNGIKARVDARRAT